MGIRSYSYCCIVLAYLFMLLCVFSFHFIDVKGFRTYVVRSRSKVPQFFFSREWKQVET
jgi:hypothetical protein